jgi:thiosulfate dehydrogenase
VKAFVAGLIIGALLLTLAVVFYFISGRAPAAVEDQPLPFERLLAGGALHAHVDREMPKAAPIADNESTLLAGAQVYQEHCAICHGLPNQDQTAMARGMFPKPPHLFRGKGVTDDPAGETYWKLANGIRLTGMPEFKHALSETQMWQVSLLVAEADKISDAVKQQLKPPSPPGSEPGPVSPARQGLSGKMESSRKPMVPPATPELMLGRKARR